MHVNGSDDKKIKQYDLQQVKGGLSRKDLNNDAKKLSIFDAIDTDKNGILDDTEMSVFQKADTNSDNVLSQGETKQFIKDFNLKEQKINKEDILKFLNEIGDNKNLKNVKNAVKDDKGNVIITYKDESTDVIQPDGKRINTQPGDNSINQPEIITVYDGDTKVSETFIQKKGTEEETQECTEYENGNAVSTIKKNSKGEIVAKYVYVNGKTSKSIIYGADGSITETTYDTNAAKEYAVSTTITTDTDGNTVETHYDTSSEQEQEVITKKITTTNNGNNVETVEYENGKPKTAVVEKDNKVFNYEYDDTCSTRRLTSSVYGTDSDNPTIYTYEYVETDSTTYSVTGSNIEGNHISNIYHDGKTGKDYIVNYDGEGNTYIVVQDQETISQICRKFGMTQEEFRELNGNINLDDNMVGCEIKVKGELKANDDRLTKRLSGSDAMKAMNNRIWAQQRAEQLEARRKADLAECNRREVYQRRINNANINSFRDLALYLYGIEGVKTITPEQLQLRINQLASLNPNIKTKADWDHANLIVNVAMSPEHIAGLKAESELRGISKEYPVSPKYGGLRSDGLQHWGYCGNIYAIARHLYFQENFSLDIPEEQLAYRAQEIRDMNPGFFDANGNVIKEGNIKVKISANNYRYQQQVQREQQQIEAQKEAMAKNPVKLFYSVADNYTGNTSIDKWEEYFFGKNAKFPINENNIVEIMGNYEKYIKTTTSDKSIFDTICSERGADDEKRIDLCNRIFRMLELAAQKAGVKQNVITYARNKFRTSMNNEFNSAGTVNTIEMDEAANYLRNQIISAQTGGTVTGNESSQALTQLRDNYDEVSKTYNDARKEDGWTGKTGDVICGWFGCNTREDMKKMLGDEYDKVMALQNCKTEAEFNAKFREIFGVNFKPENIAAYNRLQEQYKNAAAAQAAISALDNAIKLGNSSQSMINEIKKTMQGVSEAQKDQAIENIIQAYGHSGLDMSHEVNRRNALRAYIEEQKAKLQEMYNANTNGGRDSLDDILTKMDQVRQGTFGTRDIGERVARFNENMQITEMAATAGFEILSTIALQFVPGVGQAAMARLGRWGIKAVKLARGAKSINTGVKATSTAEKAATAAKTAFTAGNAAKEASALRTAGRAAWSVTSTGAATATVDISNLKSKDFDLTTEDGRQKYEEAKKEVGKRILMNMSFAGVGAGSSVLAPRLMSTFGIESKLATEIAEEVINAAGSYGISSIAGDEYGSTDAAIDILSGLIIARIAHVKGGTSTPKADTPTIPKADISAASIDTPVTPKVDVSGTSAAPKTNPQITSSTAARSGAHVEETISLSEIDRHTRVEEINQANLSPHSFDLVSSRQAQEQVGNYLDHLLETIPDDLPEVPISSVKTYDDYILPDGTVISRNFAGDTGELVFDELSQKYVVPEVDNAVLFWIKDTNGVEHVLPALTPDNVAKAKKLLAYMSTQEVIPREKIGEVQAQFLGKNAGTPVTPKADAPAPEADAHVNSKHNDLDEQVRTNDTSDPPTQESIKETYEQINQIGETIQSDEIPTQYSNLWNDCKQKINSFMNELSLSLRNLNIQTLSQKYNSIKSDIATLINNVGPATREKLTKMFAALEHQFFNAMSYSGAGLQYVSSPLFTDKSVRDLICKTAKYRYTHNIDTETMQAIFIRKLHSSMETNPALTQLCRDLKTDTPLTLYRIDSLDPFWNTYTSDRMETFGSLMYNAKKTGDTETVLRMLNSGDVTVTFPNYMGTSVTKITNRFAGMGLLAGNAPAVRWEINAPAGTEGAYIESLMLSGASYEGEFLVQAGSSLRITEVSYSNGTWHLKADLVQRTDAQATPTVPKADKLQGDVSVATVQQWQKIKIGDEEIEVPITKNADGSDNVDFTHGRKLNASGEYEYFDITTKDDIMSNGSSSQGTVRENPLETDVVKPETEVKQSVMSSVKGSDEALKTADLTDESVQDRFLAMLDEEMPSSRRMPRRVRALQAMQKLINSPEYSQLDDFHKQLAKLSTMRSNLIDPYVVLDDIKIPIEMKQRLSDIETCLKSPTTAAALYKDGDFDTLMVLAKQQGLDDATISKMKEAYSAAQTNGCLLVRQSQVNPDGIPIKEMTKDGQTYNVRVIDCTDPDVFANPEKYGLESGTTAENMQLTVHMNDGINQHPQQTIGRMRQSDNLNLSATITDGQSALYGGQQVGLFLDYDMGSVSYASNYAAGTGFCKSNTDFAQSKLSLSESSRGTFIRERFIEHINKGGFGITQEDYAAFSRQFQNKNLSRQDLIEISENGMININGKKVPLEQVEQALFASSDDLMRISYEMRGSIVDNGFNEVNIFHPTIKGIYIRGNNADDTLEKIISPQLLEYAQKNDIPIIFQRKSA